MKSMASNVLQSSYACYDVLVINIFARPPIFDVRSYVREYSNLSNLGRKFIPKRKIFN